MKLSSARVLRLASHEVERLELENERLRLTLRDVQTLAKTVLNLGAMKAAMGYQVETIFALTGAALKEDAASDTPLTDAESFPFEHANLEVEQVVSADFCRLLEREAAGLRSALEQYLSAKPQCSCTDPACHMQAARLRAKAMLTARDDKWVK